MTMNKTVEIIYNSYLEDQEAAVPHELAADLSRISAAADDKLEAGSLTCADLGEYEEAAQHKAFYAGFYAALELFRGAGQMTV